MTSYICTTQQGFDSIYLSDRALSYRIFFSGSFLTRLLRRTTTSLSDEVVSTRWCCDFDTDRSLHSPSSDSCFTSKLRFSLPRCKRAVLFFSEIAGLEVCFEEALEEDTRLLSSLSESTSPVELFASLIASVAFVLLRLRAKRDEFGTLEFKVFTFPDPVSNFDASVVTAVPFVGLFKFFETGLSLRGDSNGESLFELSRMSPALSLPPSISSRAEFGEPEFRCREVKRFAKPPNLLPGRGRSGWLFCNSTHN